MNASIAFDIGDIIVRRKARIVLEPGEVLRLHPISNTVRVVAGRAWITAQGEDILAGKNQQVVLKASSSPALISALGTRALTIEIRRH